MATGRAVNGTGLVQYAWVTGSDSPSSISPKSGLTLNGDASRLIDEPYLKVKYSRRFTTNSLLSKAKGHEGIEISLTDSKQLQELLELLTALKHKNEDLVLGINFKSSTAPSKHIYSLIECPALNYFCIKSTAANTRLLENNSTLIKNFTTTTTNGTDIKGTDGSDYIVFNRKKTPDVNLRPPEPLDPPSRPVDYPSPFGNGHKSTTSLLPPVNKELKRSSRSFTSFIIPSSESMAPLLYNLPSDLDLDKFIPDDETQDKMPSQLTTDPDYMLKFAICFLIFVWVSFIVIIGQLFGLWDYVFDIHEDISSYEDYEDLTGFPIPGYYLNMVLLTPVILWIWCVASWVGMKFFRHSKGGEESIRVD